MFATNSFMHRCAILRLTETTKCNNKYYRQNHSKVEKVVQLSRLVIHPGAFFRFLSLLINKAVALCLQFE